MTINKGRYLLRTVRSEDVNELEKLGELIKVDDTYFYLLKSNCSISDIVKIKMVDIIDANGYKLTTYLRIPLGNDGKYKLEPIKGKWSSTDYVSSYIKVNKVGNGKSKSIHYSEIDKEFFVKQLTNDGFVSGILDEKVDVIKIKNKARQDEIIKLREQMWKLEKQIKELEE